MHDLRAGQVIVASDDEFVTEAPFPFGFRLADLLG
jgi:hypothetical protein